MSLEAKLLAFAQAVGVDIGELVTSRGDLSQLTTTQKGNLVAAINELKAGLSSIDLTAIIDDAALAGVTDKTWSADKIISALDQVKTDIIAGAPAAYDTLLEISQYLAANNDQITSILEAIGKRVRYDAAQTLTTAEKKQACDNIGVGDPEVDLVAAYVLAKA